MLNRAANNYKKKLALNESLSDNGGDYRIIGLIVFHKAILCTLFKLMPVEELVHSSRLVWAQTEITKSELGFGR